MEAHRQTWQGLVDRIFWGRSHRDDLPPPFERAFVREQAGMAVVDAFVHPVAWYNVAGVRDMRDHVPVVQTELRNDGPFGPVLYRVKRWIGGKESWFEGVLVAWFERRECWLPWARAILEVFPDEASAEEAWHKMEAAMPEGFR